MRWGLFSPLPRKPSGHSEQGPEKGIQLERMNPSKDKRIVAAVTAVYRYLRSQEEQQLAMAAISRPVSALAQRAVSLWSASGRQAVMDMRRLLQLRMMH